MSVPSQKGSSPFNPLVEGSQALRAHKGFNAQNQVKPYRVAETAPSGHLANSIAAVSFQLACVKRQRMRQNEGSRRRLFVSTKKAADVKESNPTGP